MNQFILEEQQQQGLQRNFVDSELKQSNSLVSKTKKNYENYSKAQIKLFQLRHNIAEQKKLLKRNEKLNQYIVKQLDASEQLIYHNNSTPNPQMLEKIDFCCQTDEITANQNGAPFSVENDPFQLMGIIAKKNRQLESKLQQLNQQTQQQHQENTIYSDLYSAICYQKERMQLITDQMRQSQVLQQEEQYELNRKRQSLLEEKVASQSRANEQVIQSMQTKRTEISRIILLIESKMPRLACADQQQIAELLQMYNN